MANFLLLRSVIKQPPAPARSDTAEAQAEVACTAALA